MPSVVLNGLEVQFPFEPYEVQTALMSKVIECLKDRKHGLLESPTGTGKTLSLLCSAIAWQRQQKSSGNASSNDIAADLARLASGNWKHPGFGKMKPIQNLEGNGGPKIIYASRTHSQLSQAVQELRRSFYRDTKAIVLGSRDQMCIHEEVSRLEFSSAKIAGCLIRVHNHTCAYYNNVSRAKKESAFVREQAVVDIEDLVKKGRSNKFCPFYMSREIVSEADVVFMPYNYLLDPKLRSSHGLDLRNCVIILDEGHNIAKMCEDSVSFEIKSSTIAHCIQEVTKALNEYSETTQQIGNNALTKDLSLGNLISLKQSFLMLEEGLDKIQVPKDGIVLPGSDILTIIFQHGFPPTGINRIIGDLDAVTSFLSNSSHDSTGCDEFSSILRVLASPSINRNPALFGQSYKVFVQEEEVKKKKGDIRSYEARGDTPKAKLFNFWCFNPAVGLETLLMFGPRCILLASGTLSPMAFLAKELHVPFPVQLSNPHIIRDNQLLARIVPTGPGNIRLSSSFNNRNDKTYLKSLGELIRQVCTVVSKGVLVFFPSYSVMEICRREWEQNGVWAGLTQVKKVMFEPKGKDAFKQMMDEFYAAVRVNNGACLMAVCRGKVSEGLDFTDDNGRAVIITGIPYSPAKDPHIVAKQQYLNSKVGRGEADSITGSMWYQLEATRALNQAIGRIIRHVADYGVILICDERCAAPNFQSNLSKWVRDRLSVSPSFDTMMRDLNTFFGVSVQKERNDFAKSLMLRSSGGIEVARSKDDMMASNPAVLMQMQGHVMTEEELEDMYGSKECVTVYSSGKAPKNVVSPLTNQATKGGQKAQKLNVAAIFGDLMSSSTSHNPTNFSKPAAVYPKPFVAFSQSRPEVTIHPKKKIKLAHNNFSYSSASTSTTKPSTDTNSAGEPMSEQEFWAWVKGVLPSASLSSFVKSLKKYRASKDIAALGENVRRLFPSSSHSKVVLGLMKLINAKDLEKLQGILS